jgi:hypothetical protein
MPGIPAHPQQPSRGLPDPADRPGIAALILRAQPDRLPARLRAERRGVALGGQGGRDHVHGPQGQVWRPVPHAPGPRRLQGRGHGLQHGQDGRLGGGAAEEAARRAGREDGQGGGDREPQGRWEAGEQARAGQAGAGAAARLQEEGAARAGGGLGQGEGRGQPEGRGRGLADGQGAGRWAGDAPEFEVADPGAAEEGD